MRILSKNSVYRGWLRVWKAEIEGEAGEVFSREVEDHGGGAAVLPFDPRRRTAVLVRQVRFGALLNGETEPALLEAPAGLSDEDDASGADTVRREALEEAGLALAHLVEVGRCYTSPGITTESLTLFLGEYDEAARIGAGGGVADEHESIEVVEIPLAELARMADAGEIRDMKTLALVQGLRLRRPELFGAER